MFLFLQGMLGLSQDLIMLNQNIELNIEVKDGQFSIKEEHTELKEIQSDHNSGLSEQIYYSSLDKLLKFDAKTIVSTNKGKLKTISVKTWETSSVDQRGVFYSGQEKVEFDYPNTIKGAQCALNYSKEIHDPQFVSSFVFGNNYPVKSLTFSITFPKHVDVHLELIQADSLEVNYHSTVIEDKETHVYTIQNIPEYREIEKLKSYLYILPQMMVRIKSYEAKDGRRINIGNDVSDLYAWYSSLISKIADVDSEALKINLRNKVDELVNTLTTEEEKVEAIYNWVQHNIKYIAFEDGMNGFIPRNAFQILDNRYGDCKDMANLIKTMLEYAEIPAYFTWIGTRSKPYTYNDVPNVCVDNHMICTVKLDGKYVFLDGTNANLPFNSIPSEIQGKQALIGLADTVFDLVYVPVSDYTYTMRQDSLKLILKDKLLIGDVQSTFSGYTNETFKYLVDLGKSRGVDDFYLRYLDIGTKGYAVKGTIVEKGDISSKVNMKARFDNYTIETNSKLYVLPTIIDFYNTLAVDHLSERQVDLHEDYKYNHNVVTQIEIPEGYKPKRIPDELILEYPQYAFKQSITYKEGVIEIKQDLIIDFIVLREKYFTDYETFLKGLKSVQRKKIALIKE